MFSALVLAAAVHFIPGQLDAPLAEPERAARLEPTDAAQPTDLAEAPRAVDRTAHFAGAFIGGFVGGAVPLLVSAFRTCSSPLCFAGAFTVESVFTDFLWPMYAQLGATLGTAIAGGGFQLGAIMLGASAGTFLSQLLLLAGEGLMQPSSSGAFGFGATLRPEQSIPFLLASAALAGGGAAAGVLFRGLQLDHNPSARANAQATARMFVTSLMTALSLATSTFGVIAVAAAFGFISPFLPIAVGVLTSVGVGLTAWGFHRLMGGQGALWAAFPPLLASAALILFGFFPSSPTVAPLSPARRGGIVGIGGPLAIMGPAFAMEASAGLYPEVGVSVMPIPGGVMGGVTIPL